MNIFEQATRNKIRFDSPRGQLSVEDMWGLPLTAKSGMSLNDIGMTVQKKLREVDGGSLVESARVTDTNHLGLQLDIIKHIIDVRQNEAKAATIAKEKADRAARLRQILAEKQDDAMTNLSEEEIRAQLAALEG